MFGIRTLADCSTRQVLHYYAKTRQEFSAFGIVKLFVIHTIYIHTYIQYMSDIIIYSLCIYEGGMKSEILNID